MICKKLVVFIKFFNIIPRKKIISLNSSITIWDREEKIPEDEFVFFWNGYKDIGEGKSILLILEENSDEIREKYFQIRNEILNEITKKGSFFSNSKKIQRQLLWMSRLIESCIMKSGIYLDILRLLSIDHVLRNSNLKMIKYVGPKKTIAISLEEYCRRQSIDFCWKKVKPQENILWIRKIWNNLPITIKSIIWFFKYISQHWSLKTLKKPNWFKGKKSIFLFSYFAHLNKESCESGLFFSGQWGILPQLMQKMGNLLNWSHIFLLSRNVPDTRTGLRWLNTFNRDTKKQGAHVFLDTFLDLKLILKSLVLFTKIKFQYIGHGTQIEKSINKIEYGWLWPVLKIDWLDSIIGTTALYNIFLIQIFDKMLGNIPNQKQGFFLWENQGWEKAFLYAWRKHNHGRIIGIAHSTIRYWDLRYYDSKIREDYIDFPRPHAYAINGPYAWLNLKNSGQPMKHCVKVEAIRYLYLNKLKRSNKREGTKIKKLLFLGDINKKRSHDIMLILEKTFLNVDLSLEILIKPHPHNNIILNNYPKLKATLIHTPLIELLKDIDIAFSSVFTSATLDVFSANIPVINYLDPNDINYCSIRGVEGMYYISTADELSKALKKNKFDEFRNLQKQDFLWLDQDLPKWKGLLEKLNFSNMENINTVK